MTESLARTMRVAAPVFVLLLVSGADRLEAGATTGTPSPVRVAVAAAAVAEPAVRQEPAESGAAAEPVSLPLPREREVGVSGSPLPRREPHDGVSADLFRGHRWFVPPAPPAVRKTVVPVRREPQAPPLPYKLLGIYEQAGSEPLYLLVNNDRIFEASIGDTLEETYRVDGVSNGQLMLTYLPLQTSQGIRLGD